MQGQISFIHQKLLVFSAVSLILSVSSTVSAQNLSAKALIRDGVAFCRAANVQRGDDIEQAESSFQRYEQNLRRALELDRGITESDSAVKRAVSFCNKVRDDLDRARALPLIEQGFRYCGIARRALADNDIQQAQTSRESYLQLKSEAMQLSQSVMQVYENSYELRLCEQLDSAIADSVKQQQIALEQQATLQQDVLSAVELYQGAVGQCQQAQDILTDESGFDENTEIRVRRLTDESLRRKRNAAQLIRQVRENNFTLNQDDSQQIESLLIEVSDCEQQINPGLDRLAQILADQQPAPVVVETETEPVVNEPVEQTVEPRLPSSDYRQIVGAPPVYPSRALDQGLEGYVVLEFTIDKRGRVRKPKVVETEPSSGVFNSSAIKAVRKYRYEPRIIRGEPVEVSGVKVKQTFKIQ